jgi:hypothetical protein
MKHIGTLLLVAALLGGAYSVFAVPQTINYQGYLVRPDGTPLDTTVSMTFILYTSSIGGSAVWTESQPAVTVTDGLFAVQLGAVTPLTETVITGAARWLSLAVGTDGEMTPRTPVVSVAHAYRVGTVDGAKGGVISGALQADTLKTVAGIRFGNGTIQSSAFDTSGLATRVWVQSNGYLIGSNNFVSATGIVGGGSYNKARGDYSTVCGGGGPSARDSNSVTGDFSFIGGGRHNFVGGDSSVICGGTGNLALLQNATVCGGRGNQANWHSFIGGGIENSAFGQATVIGGGYSNYVDGMGEYGTIGGGANNRTMDYGTVGGGFNNNAASHAAIGGGHNNYAGIYGVVPGGIDNRAEGFVSFAAGDSATVSGDHSFVLGSRITCAAESAFVWSDGCGPVFSIGSSRTFNVKATNGTRIYTSSDLTSGVRVGAGGSSWVAVSDSTKKRQIRGLDIQDILNRFSALPLKRWEYQSEEPGVEHIGPMAQDFWNSFHLGNDPLGISTIDADGVMMAALQALTVKNMELERQLLELKTEVQALKAGH